MTLEIGLPTLFVRTPSRTPSRNGAASAGFDASLLAKRALARVFISFAIPFITTSMPGVDFPDDSKPVVGQKYLPIFQW
jgi:hypothetical protein